MKEAQFQYKCRRCSKIVVNPSCAAEYGISELHAAITKTKHFLGGHNPELHGIHGCEDGGAGVTDLLGFSIVGTDDEKFD